MTESDNPIPLTAEQIEMQRAIHNYATHWRVTTEAYQQLLERFGLPEATPDQLSLHNKTLPPPKREPKPEDPHSGGFYTGQKK